MFEPVVLSKQENDLLAGGQKLYPVSDEEINNLFKLVERQSPEIRAFKKAEKIAAQIKKLRMHTALTKKIEKLQIEKGFLNNELETAKDEPLENELAEIELRLTACTAAVKAAAMADDRYKEAVRAQGYSAEARRNLEIWDQAIKSSVNLKMTDVLVRKEQVLEALKPSRQKFVDIKANIELIREKILAIHKEEAVLETKAGALQKEATDLLIEVGYSPKVALQAVKDLIHKA